MTGTISNIVYNGLTYEVTAKVGGVEVTFFTTHPHEEELRYHLRKQHEMIKNCQKISNDYLVTYKDFIGKDLEFSEGDSVAKP